MKINARKPHWLKVKLPSGDNFKRVNRLLNDSGLHTICREAKCPNRAECFSNKTATFLILGDKCTRNCLYCNVTHFKPDFYDENEALKIARVVRSLGLRYVVVTSVTRDDLPDCGAGAFCDTVNEIRRLNPDTKIELLIPDMKGKRELLKAIVDSKPDVLGHNIEVVKKIFPSLRPQGNYETSVNVLRMIKEINTNQKTKSGLMVGFSESREDIISTMKDLINAEVDFFTIGQYLQPRKNLSEVERFYTPDEFTELKKEGEKLGFSHVESGPLVRSSYRADKLLKQIQ